MAEAVSCKASHRGDMGSIPGRSIRVLWWD